MSKWSFGSSLSQRISFSHEIVEKIDAPKKSKSDGKDDGKEMQLTRRYTARPLGMSTDRQLTNRSDNAVSAACLPARACYCVFVFRLFAALVSTLM